MAQNIYDRPEFFEGYSRLDRSVRGLDGGPEWPVLRALLPDMSGRRALDLGCGFGWIARWAASQGAASVLGVDLSENMLARARAETADPRVRYLKADLESLELPRETFDLAVSSLALHYVEDFGRLVGAVSRALVSGGHFVFSIEHPIYMASVTPGWLATEEGGRTWPVDHYAIEGARITDWLAKGVRKQHRTLGTTLNTLIDAGFALRRLVEWSPTPEQLAAQPSLAEEMERPMMAIVAAQKSSDRPRN
ncbi:MAG TPA: class I SAM-dependent methyltransferase [Roseiarcus sp.]|nr:class I SAM-dependent methyltransferase [Roseiarcus sp.]